MVLASPVASIGVVREALAEAVPRFAHLLRLGPDPDRPAIGTWSVGEAAAHVAASAPFFLAVARGEIEPEHIDEVTATNEEILASDPERDPRALADRFEAGEQALLAYVEGVDGDPTLEVFEGVRAPLSSLLAVELAEVLVHGYDIARASGNAWRIGRAEAGSVVGGLVPLLPHFVDREAAAGRSSRFELRIRGAFRIVLEFDGGTLRLLLPDRRPVDCRISVDPAAFLLLIYGRIGPLRPMLQGKLAAWGRRPWRAAAFPSLFRTV
jgi:uncharacterized protein (TIGR03083 family)